MINSNEKHDLIILDAYTADYVPFHLLTQEFFQIINEHLEPEGVVISNLIGSLEGDTSDLLRTAYTTMQSVFSTVYVFTIYDIYLSNTQNLIFVAIQYTSQSDRYDLERLAAQNKVNEILGYTKYLERCYSSGMMTYNVSIFTDDFSSVEIIINPLTSQPYFDEDPYFHKILDGLMKVQL